MSLPHEISKTELSYIRLQCVQPKLLVRPGNSHQEITKRYTADLKVPAKAHQIIRRVSSHEYACHHEK